MQNQFSFNYKPLKYIDTHLIINLFFKAFFLEESKTILCNVILNFVQFNV